ncbi:MAG: hypothetical protein VW268_15300 [Rhodospirillaceae bacterium]
MNDVIERRRILAPVANPERRLDYLVMLTGGLETTHGRAVSVAIRYVPDAQIVSAENVWAYLAVIAEADWQSLEALAATVMADFADETVARWIEVTVASAEDDLPRHQVTLVDRQPGWDNPPLISGAKG